MGRIFSPENEDSFVTKLREFIERHEAAEKRLSADELVSRIFGIFSMNQGRHVGQCTECGEVFVLVGNKARYLKFDEGTEPASIFY